MRLNECRECGTLQHSTELRAAHVLRCVNCESTLARIHGQNADAALASSAAAFVLLLAANLAPFLATSVAGVSRQSWMVSSVQAMFDNGFPELSFAVAMLTIVLPVLRSGLLSLVLGTLKTPYRPAWLGPTFRISNALRPWAMADVFLLGCVVAYARLQTQLFVEIFAGAYLLGAGAILMLVSRATLDVGATWRAIGPDHSPRPAPDQALACLSCSLLVSRGIEGQACPRCRSRLHARKPNAVGRSAALALAAALLYLPANLYPMATLPIGTTSVKYNVLEGVVDLFDANLYGLGLLVLIASFAIPLAKLLGLGWCIVSVLTRSDRHLRAKTRVFAAIEEIGRWSMVDILVICCFVPLTQYNSLIYGRAELAAPAFAAVVILTTLAATSFDPRLMWDAAIRKGSRS